MSWTRATHLNHWADTELASRRLPLLVRRLIRKTVSDLIRLNVPANEQTVRPGFDGIVECSVGNQYVPSGKSVWEMGTDLEPKTKANRDIAKRTKEWSDSPQRAETTLVFVTPRPWHKKDEWAEEMVREGGWKGVIVHDSNDLEHWLDLARDVDAWISHETGQVPAGVQSLEYYWKSLRDIGEQTLLPAVFTTSRETEIQSVEQLLSREPSSLFIRTPSLSDGIDFLAALAAHKSEEFQMSDPAVEPQQLSLLQNAVIVFNHDDWRKLAQSVGPLLLIASPTLQISSTDVAYAVQSGHYVIVCGPRGIIPQDKGIVLRGVQQYELEKSLENILDAYYHSGTPYVFQENAEAHGQFKRNIANEIATAFGISCHPLHVVVCGSAHLGFSAAPSAKFGKPFSFEESDIDIAILLPELFDRWWFELVRPKVVLQKRRLIANHLLNGYINPKLVCDSTTTGKRWWDLFRKLKAGSLKRVRGRIYRDPHFMQNYHRLSVIRGREKLMGARA